MWSKGRRTLWIRQEIVALVVDNKCPGSWRSCQEFQSFVRMHDSVSYTIHLGIVPWFASIFLKTKLATNRHGVPSGEMLSPVISYNMTNSNKFSFQKQLLSWHFHVTIECNFIFPLFFLASQNHIPLRKMTFTNSAYLKIFSFSFFLGLYHHISLFS